jgi:hypothetical protein
VQKNAAVATPVADLKVSATGGVLSC